MNTKNQRNIKFMISLSQHAAVAAVITCSKCDNSCTISSNEGVIHRHHTKINSLHLLVVIEIGLFGHVKVVSKWNPNQRCQTSLAKWISYQSVTLYLNRIDACFPEWLKRWMTKYLICLVNVPIRLIICSEGLMSLRSQDSFSLIINLTVDDWMQDFVGWETNFIFPVMID